MYFEDGLGKVEFKGIVYVIDDFDVCDGFVFVCFFRVVLRGRYVGNFWFGGRLLFCGFVFLIVVFGFVFKDFGELSEVFMMWVVVCSYS